MGLLDLLQQALGNNAEKHFDAVAQQAPPDQLGAGLAEVMRSKETPPFGNMVSQMFGQSSPTLQAGVLNQILAALGPAAATALASDALGRALAPGQSQLTPEQAAQVSPDQVSEIATQAEQAQPRRGRSGQPVLCPAFGADQGVRRRCAGHCDGQNEEQPGPGPSLKAAADVQ